MVYLIHFETKLFRHGHYLGMSKNEFTYKKRINHHRKGTGAKILRRVNEAGINWSVVREWPNEDGKFESILKKRKKSFSKYCPICNQQLSQNLIPMMQPDQIDASLPESILSMDVPL